MINPMVRLGLDLGVAPRAFALLETTGRRSGKRRRVPVGSGLMGDIFWLVSERGAGADYVRNMQADPRVRVKVGRTWRAGTATVLPEDDAAARLQQIVDSQGWLRRVDAGILRSASKTHGTTPVSVRIDLDG